MQAGLVVARQRMRAPLAQLPQGRRSASLCCMRPRQCTLQASFYVSCWHALQTRDDSCSRCCCSSGVCGRAQRGLHLADTRRAPPGWRQREGLLRVSADSCLQTIHMHQRQLLPAAPCTRCWCLRPAHPAAAALPCVHASSVPSSVPSAACALAWHLRALTLCMQKQKAVV